MALSNSEIARIKLELGYNLLSVGAIPYIGITAIFEQVIQPNLGGGAATTSSSSVSSSTSATPVDLTLASATGFAAGQRVAIDVDDLQEIATVRNMVGSVISVALRLTHTGTYPVVVEGGESLVREILSRIRDKKAELASAHGVGVLKKVDEVEFYQAYGTMFGQLGHELTFWRNELSSALGIDSLWAMKQGGAQRCAVY